MAKQPNIVFYFSDQQRADTCGIYGQSLDITPNLDKLATEGTVFENAYTPQPVCGPCRAIFQTGVYATALDCFRNNKMLPLTVKTLANYMEGAGYDTAYVGKWHLASEGNLEEKPYIDYQTVAIPPLYRGGYTGFWRASDVLEFTSDGFGGYVFDEHMKKHEFKGYRATCITDYALEFLDGRTPDEEKPFFLTVSHIEPHHQNDAHHYQGPEGSKEKYAAFKVPVDLASLPDGDWREEYPDYLGACHAVDENLGRVIAKLKEKGLYDNTVIIYTSDHGSHFRTRNRDKGLNGYDDYKRTCHDAATHVPLVISGGPFSQKGRRVEEMVSTISLPKTIAALAGIDTGRAMEGENLSDVASGILKEDRKDECFIQISESRVGRALRTRDYLYAIVAPGLNGGAAGTADAYRDDFLYDLAKDPYELDNVVGKKEYEAIKVDLNKRLLSWIKEAEGIDVKMV